MSAVAEIVRSNRGEAVAVADMKAFRNDPYGCLLGGIPSRINLATDETPRTVEEIAARIGGEPKIDPKRVQLHFDVCTREKKHIGPYLTKTEDGKYSATMPAPKPVETKAVEAKEEVAPEAPAAV